MYAIIAGKLGNNLVQINDYSKYIMIRYKNKK